MRCPMDKDDENNLLHVPYLHSYPGVVSIRTSGGSGTGFFISRNVVATAFHVISNLECQGSIEKRIYLEDFPERSPFEVRTRRKSFFPAPVPSVPVSEIVALDAKHDIALLRFEGYISEFFYPLVASVPDDILSREVKIPGFPGRNPRIIDRESLFVSNYDHLDSDSFFGMVRRSFESAKGASGSPVLSSNGDLLGVYVEEMIMDEIKMSLDLFVSVENLWNLLEKPSLSCVDTSCIRDELRVLEEQAESGDRQAQYRFGSVSDDGLKWFWWEKAAENGHPNAQFFLGRRNFYRTGETYWLERSAAQGHPPAQ